ncbi:MAG: L-serine ammonia-lyase, iron-sulfur-dependent, subunit alpha [Eubacteriales bacterium]|nr:L-serine ammonia-lyase, iron-sulfur-dependent, subunit alpha [Eubacteriales bacterium]
MEWIEETKKLYLDILREELVPALGCTEPIAVAYASAVTRRTLGCFPERILAECSGNIIKNVKGVIVPMSGQMRGVEAAAVLGCVGGDPERRLEVLEGVTQEHILRTRELLDERLCEVRLLDTRAKLHIRITMTAGDRSAVTEVVHTHTGIVYQEKDGETLLSVPYDEEEAEAGLTDRSCLTVERIIQFADTVPLAQIRPILEPQIACNSAISDEGIRGKYGAAIGATILDNYGNDIKVRARARAAAGSDARMGGCVFPVVINSGSGNQGMTVSIPVIEYWKELELPEEALYRALCVSNLVAIHQKSQIGRLSAFCGAVSAAAGAGAAIAYLHGAGVEDIGATIVNTLANVAGIVCDGAKPSCAAKIASCVDAAIMGYMQTCRSRNFSPGEGIVGEDVEQTISDVSRIAREGMGVTDEEILKIMTASR